MRKERLVTFIDGQNLYRTCKEAFGYHYPNYDVNKLSQKIAKENGWSLSRINFYTGIPDSAEDTFWHGFWSKKLAVMGTRGVHTFRRTVRYQDEKVKLKDGSVEIIRVGHEKGIDVRLALDVVRLALENAYDVAVIFSQDQDLSEVVDDINIISKKNNRLIRIFSAYPVSPIYRNQRGIDKARWIKMDKAFYDACIDPIDYRPKDTFNPLFTDLK
ncbi:MAG: NYN domain-containing protein [Candidatus Omnitrophica bacterium CG07_land_8_20_14_0_80_50_8]|nr:MAG: NYN domain-containing protein [Candidatus Omnitrophica bacterium CG07_land_8_20_14_0_80_50_8]